MMWPNFAQLRRGAGDPTHRQVGDIYLRATRTPAGPALIKIITNGAEVAARAWGEGGEWSLDQLPRLFGAADDPGGFRPRPEHGPLVEAWQRYHHYRVGRTEAVFEALAPACIEQVVTGKEAFRAWRLLVREFGEPAPGPAREPGSAAYGMYLPPTPETWSRVPSWRFLAAGVEQRRSGTQDRTASRAASLERTLTWSHHQVDQALQSFPGVGPWTSAEVRQRAHGDPDAWSIGDYHVGKDITYALTGEQLDDDACLEILEPYRGHRFRVQMLLSMVSRRRPRRAPRITLPTHTPYATRGRS
ncbi:MAG TPA: DNA-3-methyladenine glycosylase 2 family protein [Propionibacteriaceae bacterium]|nr:DNA-3-methyladenine glycosylase 2 family protein [Propionibacteriaceae bacterium]